MAAVEFVPASGLVSIHNTARLMGSNALTLQGISLQGGGSITYESVQGTPAYNYFVGLIVPAVIMIIIFLIWGCSLICAKKCCKGGCSKNVALSFFVLFCLGSLGGWVLGLVGNVNTTNGFNAMVEGITDVQDFSQDVVGIADQANNVTSILSALALEMDIQCNNSNVSFPLQGISGGLNASLPSGVVELKNQVNGFNSQIDTYKSISVQYLAWRETGTMIVIVVIMVVLSLFMVSTTLRVMDSTPECCRPIARCSSRSTSCIVFIFGILLLLIIWIFVAIIHVIVTFGADLCVPSVNSNINRLVTEVANNDFSGQNPCTGNVTGPLGILCYYQTCQGASPLGDQIDQLNVNSSATQMRNFRDELIGNLTQYNITINSTCFESIDSFLNGTDLIFDTVQDATDLAACSSINPVYASLLYDGVCNGLFNGLVFTYVSCIVACVFMMAAMSIFRIFDFDRYEEGRLPEAYYDDAGGKGGQVVSTGGPIVKDV